MERAFLTHGAFLNLSWEVCAFSQGFVQREPAFPFARGLSVLAAAGWVPSSRRCCLNFPTHNTSRFYRRSPSSDSLGQEASHHRLVPWVRPSVVGTSDQTLARGAVCPVLSVCHPLPGEGQGLGSCVSPRVCKGFTSLPCRDVDSADMEGSLYISAHSAINTPV